MDIVYRRMSGAIGLTDQEKGTRGLWLEKRRALLLLLETRGHRVTLVNRFTEATAKVIPTQVPVRGDVLMVEFGSSNARFYGEDLQGTAELVDLHKGQRCIFLCDDPDLPFLWKQVKRPQDWTCWYNATRAPSFGGQPNSVGIFDAPFASLLPRPKKASTPSLPYLVYSGRAKGREQAFKNILRHVTIEVAGRDKEWSDFDISVTPMPEQSVRSAFYADRPGSLVIADRKHKRFGWRTGRAYHALYAGTPAVVEADHDALARTFQPFFDVKDLASIVKSWKDDPALRAKVWAEQMELAAKDVEVMKTTLLAAGL